MKSNQLDAFKSHLIRLIKEELEGGEDEKQAGLEKALYDTVLAPSDVNAAVSALSDVKNYGIYAQNLRDPKVILRVFGPSVPATKGRVAKETWDQSNENEKLSKIIDIKSRVPQEWSKVEQQLQSKFDDWSVENDNDSFNEFVVTLDAKDLPMDFFGKYASNYFATKTPENLKKYSGVMTKDNQFIVVGDKIVFPAKKNPFQTRDYLEKVLKTIMGNAKIQYTLSQQESDDQPKTTSNTQGKVEKINFVKTFNTPELAAKFKRLIPKDFAEKTSVEGGKITVADITDPQKKNLMATALKFAADNAPKKKSIKKSKASNPQIDKLLAIMDKTKAGPIYKKALMGLIDMAEKKSGTTVNTKKEALLALDYLEPETYDRYSKPMKEGEVEKPNPNDDYWRDTNGLTDEYYEEYKKWLEQQKKKPMKESVKDFFKDPMQATDARGWIKNPKLSQDEKRDKIKSVMKDPSKFNDLMDEFTNELKFLQKPMKESVKDQIKKAIKEVLKEKKFPDLTGDGKVTRADILKGRGVDFKKEGVSHSTKDLK